MKLVDIEPLMKNGWHLVQTGESNRFLRSMSLADVGVVDAVEVVHGHWIPTYHTYYNRDGECQIADEWHCSKCDIYSQHEWNYCPNCGAKMDSRG